MRQDVLKPRVCPMRAFLGPRLCLIVLILATHAYSQSARPEFPDPGKPGMSREEQRGLGLQTAAEVYKQMPVLPDSSPETQYIQQLGQQLVSTIPSEYSWPFEFHVVAQKEINAFALPGGPMFINIGTITASANEAELAGVMAHVLAHVYMQHSAKQAGKAQKTSIFAGIASAVLGEAGGGGLIGQLGQMGIQMGAQGLMMKYSRGDESQADFVGAVILTKLATTLRPWPTSSRHSELRAVKLLLSFSVPTRIPAIARRPSRKQSATGPRRKCTSATLDSQELVDELEGRRALLELRDVPAVGDDLDPAALDCFSEFGRVRGRDQSVVGAPENQGGYEDRIGNRYLLGHWNCLERAVGYGIGCLPILRAVDVSFARFQEALMTNKTFSFLIVIPAALFTAGTLFAHHAFGPTFDAEKVVRIKGVVTRFEWVNPHSYIIVDLKGDDGKTKQWALEGPAPNQLTRRGYAMTSIKPGDAVEACGYGTRDAAPKIDPNSGAPRHLMVVELLTLVDGDPREWSPYGHTKCRDALAAEKVALRLERSPAAPPPR